MKFRIHILLLPVIIFSSTQLIAQMLHPDSLWNPETIAIVMDSIVEKQMSKNSVPGTTYAIIKGKKLHFLDNKGYANIQEEKSMDASSTQFMMGSISKLITTVAVLQLYDKHIIDLDRPVRQYIKSIDVPFDVTLRQLLTHTGGLEESVLERVKKTSDNFLTLRDYLRQKLPSQILEPGKLAAYSNHGMALAGLVVEEISGMSYEAYVDQNIFAPLGMTTSTFNLDPHSQSNLAQPYLISNDKPAITYHEYVQTIPASMLISTSSDMAKFMEDQLLGSSLLEAATLKMMQNQQFTHHPQLLGRGFGFFERDYRGKRALEHGNTRRGYYSYMLLIPEDTLGIFVTTNGGRSNFRTGVIFDFLKEVYPKVNRDKKFLNVAQGSLSEYTGTYYSNRRNVSNFSKLILQATFVDRIEVKIEGNNAIKLLGSEFQLQSKDQFNVSDDSTTHYPVAFGRNSDGTISHLFLPGRPDSYSRMSWYQTEQMGMVVFTVSLISFLIYTIVGLIKLKRVTIQSVNNHRNSPLLKFRLGYTAINLFFLISLIVALILFGESLQYDIPGIFYFVFLWPMVGFAFLIGFSYNIVKTWNDLTNKQQLSISYLVLIASLYTWQLYIWNFLGFNF